MGEMPLKAETNRWACRAEVNLFMARSRCRVGWWEFSARLFIPEVSMDGVRPRTMKMGGCLATTPAAPWCLVSPF